MPRVLEKKERSLGTKLSIRGERCSSPKCALIRKPHPPGQHGKRFSKPSEYGLQLREKQKIRLSYGLTDNQLRRVFSEGAKAADSSIKAIAEILESRLDNAIMRLGFAESRSIARQIVTHGHITVNNKKVATPSYRVAVGDVIGVKESSRKTPYFQGLAENLKNTETPAWLSLDADKIEGKVDSSPRDVELPFNINMVVDYYSKK